MKKLSYSLFCCNGFVVDKLSNEGIVSAYVGKCLDNTLVLSKTIKYYDFEVDGEIEEKIHYLKPTIGGRVQHILFYKKNILVLKSIKDIPPIIELNNNIGYGFIYVIKSDLGYKIGKTKNIDDRLKIFNVKLPFQWQFYMLYPSLIYSEIEIALHTVFSKDNINGEWFNLNQQDLDSIKLLLHQS